MHYGIIAAGEGSRLQQEGVLLPKPLVEIEGQPMIGRLINIFVECNAETVNVIVNEQMTEVQRFLRSLASTLPVPLNIKVKSTPSSMHSFAELSSMIPSTDRFVLTTVDTIFRAEDFRRYVESFERNAEADAYMAVTSHIDDEKPLYISTDEEMNITAFTDSPEPNTRYVSGGIYGFNGKASEILEECLREGVSRMRNFQRRLLTSGLRVKAFDMGKILDVDHASDIEKADAFLSNGD